MYQGQVMPEEDSRDKDDPEGFELSHEVHALLRMCLAIPNGHPSGPNGVAKNKKISAVNLPTMARRRSRLAIKGMPVSPLSGKSSILIIPSRGHEVIAVRVQEMFTHVRPSLDAKGELISEDFLLVKRLRPLDDDEIQHDPYRKFPLFQAQLYHADLLPDAIVVRATDFVSHFVSCPYSRDDRHLQVVKAIDRVCHDSVQATVRV